MRPSRSSLGTRNACSTRGGSSPASVSDAVSFVRLNPWWPSKSSSWKEPSSSSRSTIASGPPTGSSAAKAASTGVRSGMWCSAIIVTMAARFPAPHFAGRVRRHHLRVGLAKVGGDAAQVEGLLLEVGVFGRCGGRSRERR